jgi:DNA-binding transcriptional MocR family regulator
MTLMAFNKTMAAAFKVPAITPAQRGQEPTMPGLTPSERLVLLMLCNMTDNRTAKTFAKHATVAAATGLSRATVVRAMAVLDAQGWFRKVRRRRKNGTRQSDLITLVCPTVAVVPPRLLPLMAVVSSTPAHKVAPCNSDKVAPCDYGPGSQSLTMQQHIPTTKNLSLPAGEADAIRAVDKPHDEAVAQGLRDLAATFKAKGEATQGARRTLARRAG